MADLCGHESALFAATGTLTNQLALRVHLSALDSILLDARSHVYKYECAGVCMHAQAGVTPILPKDFDHDNYYGNGFLTADWIEANLTEKDIHCAATRVVALENTMNGAVYPFAEIERIREMTRRRGLILHLDGARLWNACVASGKTLKDYGQLFDSVLP